MYFLKCALSRYQMPLGQVVSSVPGPGTELGSCCLSGMHVASNQARRHFPR